MNGWNLSTFPMYHVKGLWKNTNKNNNTKTKGEKVETDKRKRRRKRRKKKKRRRRRNSTRGWSVHQHYLVRHSTAVRPPPHHQIGSDRLVLLHFFFFFFWFNFIVRIGFCFVFGLFETYFESEAKLDRLVLPSSCVSFYFVFLFFFFFFFFKVQIQREPWETVWSRFSEPCG